MTDLTQAACMALPLLERDCASLLACHQDPTTGAIPADEPEVIAMFDEYVAAITALRAALEAPQDEPVAWAIFTPSGNARLWATKQEHLQRLVDAEGLTLTPLYAHPPAQPAKVEAQQEPFGWHRDGDAGCASHFHRGPTPPPPLSVERAVAEGWKPLYAAPQPAHPPAQPRPGWVLVPEEPTPEMCAAGVQALYAASVGDIETTGSEVRITYSAMLAARPKETT